MVTRTTCAECGKADKSITIGLCRACYKGALRFLHSTAKAEMPNLRDGACVGDEQPEAWYAYDLRDPAERRALLAHADAVCASCPVSETCAEWGLLHEMHGVWGGLLPQQRATARRELHES